MYLVRSFVFVAFWCNTCGPNTASAADQRRPNILWLITEDMGPELGCYDTPQVWTPVLDNLASRGVRYSNAFTVTPVCSTSRSGFCTGMYPTSIGAHQHRTGAKYKRPLPDGVRLITHRLQDAGYYTANIRRLGGRRLGTGKTDWNFAVDRPAFQTDRWEDLKDHQPFYAQVNFSQSHRGWSAPRRADPEKVMLPPYYPDHALARNDWAGYLDEITEVDGLIGRVLEALDADGLADNTIVVFFGDHGRAHVRGKQWCYDSGLRIPMIVYVPPGVEQPKHFEPGTVDDRLIASIDITATTLDLAGVRKPEKMQGRVFLGSRAEPPRQTTFASRDRCDMTSFRIRTVRDKHYRYVRNFMPDRPFLNINLYKERSYPMIALMRELRATGKLDSVQRQLLAMTRPAEELYWIENDPYEIDNLADTDDPRHQAALARLRGELDDWMERTGDQGRTPEDPAIGLDVLRAALQKAVRPQLKGISAVVDAQAATSGISEYYRDYLATVRTMVDAALAMRDGAEAGAGRNKQ